MGAATPGGRPIPGKPPKGMGEGGPKVTPAPLPTFGGAPNKGGLFGPLMEGIKKTDKFKDKVKEGGKGIGVPDKKSPEIFDKLLEGIKKAGGLPGGPSQGKPFGGSPIGKPAPGSDPNIVLGPDDRPMGFESPRDDSNFITEFGDTRDPNYAERKKEILEKRFPVDPRTLPTYRDAPFGGIGIGGGPGIPPRFPTGPRDPRTMRGPRKEAVFFGGKPPSTGSKRPTKGSPKGGMSKAGPVDAETRNKFEEMLAYMKSFQR